MKIMQFIILIMVVFPWPPYNYNSGYGYSEIVEQGFVCLRWIRKAIF